MTHDINGPAGRLEARLDHPTTASRAVAVIASPDPTQGGTMQDKVIYHATQGLLRVGCAVLRFNYRGIGTSEGALSHALVAVREEATAGGALRETPSPTPSRPPSPSPDSTGRERAREERTAGGAASTGTAKRGHASAVVGDAENGDAGNGRGDAAGESDVLREAREDYKAALDAAAKRYKGLPIWAVGYSFGAYVAMVSGAEDSRVSQLVGIGTVLDGYDFTTVKETDKPKILVHGERDALCSIKAIRRFYAELLEPRELVVIDMADHYFDGQASEVADTLEDLLIDDEHDDE
jgi:alpha/beta superfamily hydrolase